MRIAVVGAGAMGSLIAGLLGMAQATAQRQKAEIWLVGAESSSAQLAAIEKDGLSFELAPYVASGIPAGLRATLQSPLRNLKVTQNPAEIVPCEIAIVLVKSYRTAQAACQIQQLLAPNGLVITLQNGLGNPETLAETLKTARIIQGVAYLGGYISQPGRVFVAALSQAVIAAEPSLSVEHRGYLELLKTDLAAVGVTIKLVPDIAATVWLKLLVNCAINPVAALLDVPNGFLAENLATRQLMSEVIAEGLQVAQLVAHLSLTQDAAMAQVIRTAETTAANFCSMVQDLRKSRPTEIEALNGAIVGEAEKLGLDVPVNRTLTNLIRARQSLS